MWALLIASMALQAFSSYQQGQAQAADERQNEAIARHNALLAETDRRAQDIRTVEAQFDALFDWEQFIGSETVREGASGGLVGEPFRARARYGSLRDQAVFRIGREGRKKSEDLTQEAASSRARAKQFGERAKSAEKAGILGAGSAILGGAASGKAQGFF